MKKDGTFGFCGSATLKQTQSRPKFSQSMVVNSPPFVALREYPKGLGKALVRLWRDNKIMKTPSPCLRQKRDLNTFHSEKSLFESLPMGDVWSDAKLADCYFYLYKNKELSIPPDWVETMRKFTNELKQVPRLALGGGVWKTGFC